MSTHRTLAGGGGWRGDGGGHSPDSTRHSRDRHQWGGFSQWGSREAS